MIRKLVSVLLKKLSIGIGSISSAVYKSPHQKQVHLYKKEISNRHYMNFNINHSSVVFDVGGYEGQWSSDVYSRYRPKIHIFEPVYEFYEKINTRFEFNSDIYVHNLGLANKNSFETICISRDGSSLHNLSLVKERVKIESGSYFIKNNNIKYIDLMKINIEGSEYELLNDLIKGKVVQNVGHYKIQFHEFVENALYKYEKIAKDLRKTHTLLYRYPFVWEEWRIK